MESKPVRNLRVTKERRDTPLPDIPASFPPLHNLRLELLEVKDKLKPGLPLIPQIKIKAIEVAPQKPVETKAVETKSKEVKKKKKDNSEELVIETKEPESTTDTTTTQSLDGDKKNKKDSKKDKKNKKDKKSKKKQHIKDEKDKLAKELADSDEEEEEDEESEEDEEEEEEEEDESDEDESDEEEKDGEAAEEEYDPYAGLSPEEREAKEKEEYIWRFRILKKQYGRSASIPIPEFNEHSDLSMMKNSYERTIRELYLDDTVETYRTYLLGGWILMEYVCTQWLSIDLGGFTIQQARIMYKYDRMLIELGEKSYSKWGSSLPVEIRLLIFIVFQAAIFFIGKVLADKYGQDVAELFKGFTGQPAEPVNNNRAQTKPQTNNNNNNNQPQPTGRSKMSGPRVRAEDIRKQNNIPDVREEDED